LVLMSLAPGNKVGRYEIRSKIGQGGMGEVYLAEDSKLRRRVAIKFLPAAAVANEQANLRLLREAQSAAKLDHPNICAVHEVGEADGRNFIVMPYVEGDTLDVRMRERPLRLSEALAIATQVADALAEAHAHGIIHRDIKPSNIIITHRHQAKVMDFGLAKPSAAIDGPLAVDPEGSTQALLTTPGAILGTVPYMSPEQVHGQPLDARSDIFSFGVVLYEMLTGRQLFASESAAGTISAILTKEPSSISDYVTAFAGELQRILGKCLAKDRDRRYQTMRDVAIDLDNVRRQCEVAQLTGSHSEGTAGETGTNTDRPRSFLRFFTPRRALIMATALALLGLAALTYSRLFRKVATPLPPQVKSLAVLPFNNIGGDPQDEYLSDGIADELIAKITKLKTIRVVSLPVAMRYKNSPKDAAQIGRELGVDAVISGTVRKAGEHFRVGVHLLSTTDGFTIWADDNFDGSMQNLLDAERQLAESVVTKLRGELSPNDSALVAKNNTTNAEAYEFLLRGKEQLRKGEREIARQMFERATQLDPNFADAYAWLAFALGEQFAMGEGDRRTLDGAFANARKALTIDPNLIVAHRVLITFYRNDSQNEEALKEAKLALGINPDDQDAIKAAAHAYFEAGMLDRSIEFYNRARATDPADDDVRTRLARSYLYVHQYEKGLEVLAPALASNTWASAKWVGMLIYGRLKQYGQAAEMFERLRAAQPNDLLGYLDYGTILREAGQPEKAREVWLEGVRVGEAQAAKVENVRTRMWLGHLYAKLGKREKAVEQVKRSLDIEPKNAWVLYQSGEIHALLGDKDSAVSYLKQANERGFLEFQYYEGLDDLLGDYAEYRAVRDTLKKKVDELRDKY
jgi:serine/threonine protein kinase/tetratricopeptide (TPR) repeat protein